MKSALKSVVVVGLAAQLVLPEAAVAQSDRYPAEGGDVIITPILHASAMVEHAGRVIYIDPWSVADLSSAKPADLILVTDDPSHHFDPDAINALRKPGAPVVLNPKSQARFSGGIALENGESREFADIRVEAVAAYDMTPGEPYHPKGEANSYLISVGGLRLFFSAVGQCVPEVRALENIDVAVMPMNLPVDRMRPIPLAECLRTFSPGVFYINHYDRPHANWLADPSGEDQPYDQDTPATIRALEEAIAGLGVEFRDAGWYPPRP
jgi:L-ascorbate metabolism protein UlaG (beta-lactamase superfamily)